MEASTVCSPENITQYKGFSFDILDLGLLAYGEWLLIQKHLLREVSSGDRESTLVLCEHSPVITLGRLAKKDNIVKPLAEIESHGIEIAQSNRGGDVTLHLPGQLVVYPIFDLRRLGRDINQYLRNLEKAVILFLKEYGIEACRKNGLTGVWAGDKKIASIGIAISRWTAYHGLSLNVNCDLDLFSLIRPCGHDIMMASIALLQPSLAIKMGKIKEGLVMQFRNIFS